MGAYRSSPESRTPTSVTPPESRRSPTCRESDGPDRRPRSRASSTMGTWRPARPLGYQQILAPRDAAVPVRRRSAGTPLPRINPTAGLFDGDAPSQRRDGEKGTRTVIVGQSATRIHPSPRLQHAAVGDFRGSRGDRSSCSRGRRFRLRDAGQFRCRVIGRPGRGVPNPCVGRHRALPGRYARGEESERFRFETLIQQFEVRRRRGELGRSRSLRAGAVPGPTRSAAGTLGQRTTRTASVSFLTGDVPGRDRARPASAPGSGDTVVRSLGSGEADDRRGRCARRSGPPAWRGTPDLATNHWFCVGASASAQGDERRKPPGLDWQRKCCE